MKLVRTTFSADGQTFFLDRTYNEAQDDKTNCEAALRFVTDAIKERTLLAVMTKDSEDKVKPALLNTKNVSIVVFDDVVVGDTQSEDM
jgi:hypothetical protein